MTQPPSSLKSHYCCKSPTKAHHWMFQPQGSDNPFLAICKYCKREREFAHHSIYDAGGFTKHGWRASALPKGEKVT